MASLWSSVVKKDPPSKPPTTDGAQIGLVVDCKSTKGISMAIVDANVIIEGLQSLTNIADKFVTVPEVLSSEILDSESRRRLDLIPFTIETMEPSPQSLSKVIDFAERVGEFGNLSDVDLKLIALIYTLEAKVNGTKHLRDVPLPIRTVRVKILLDKELPAWGSNVDNLEEWEALENETEEISNSTSKILPLQDLNMNILPSEHQAEDEQEGERKQKPKKTEVKLAGKMVVEGIDASQGECNDGVWRPAVSSSTHRKFLWRKAKWEHYNALAEQQMKRDLEADKAGNLTQGTTDQMSDEKCAKDICKNDEDDELSSILKDMRLEQDSSKALQEGSEETNGEDGIEVQGEEGIASEAGDTFEASSMTDDGCSEQSWSLSESSVACITGDYAMQNVILQMGLRLLAPGGKQIRQLNRRILQCHACYTLTREMTRTFCPKCGNGGTLRSVAVTTGKNGTIISARKPRIELQGTKFPIPMPKSGREGITKNLVLREDQLPQKYLHPKTKKKASKSGDEYFISDDVFMDHHSDRKAPLQPPVRKTMAIFSQKRNPNDNHFSRSMD